MNKSNPSNSKQRILEFLLELSKPSGLDKVAWLNRKAISERTFYRDLDELRVNGFDVQHRSKESLYLNQHLLVERFTIEELIAIRRGLLAVQPKHGLLVNILKKLDDYIDPNEAINKEAVKFSQNIQNIVDALDTGHCITLHDYQSNKTAKPQTRKVEPHALVNQGEVLEAWDLQKKSWRDYKVSRIGWVEILPKRVVSNRSNKNQTDDFGMKGKEVRRITLFMNQLAANLLRDDFPKAGERIRKTNQEKEMPYVYEAEVYDYRAVGRFVLGLPGDVFVVGDEDFKAYLVKKHEKVPY